MLRFIRSVRFLFVAAAVVLLSWTVHVWSDGAADAALKSLSGAATVNLGLWLLAFVGLAIYGAIKFVRSRELSEQVTAEYYGIAVFASVALVALIAFFVWNDQNKGPFATLIGALLATAGWLTSALLTVRNHMISAKAAAESSRKGSDAAALATRKRHTFNVLIELRQNPIFNLHRDNIAARFPLGTILTADDVTAVESDMKQKREFTLVAVPRVGDSLRYVTNYYEFLCAALRQGDLDEALLKQTHRQILVGYEEKVRIFIDEMIERNGPKTYEHFRAVVATWRDDPSPPAV